MFVDVVGPDAAVDLVLVHGGLGTGALHWAKLARSVAGEYRVHLPDLPGHGRTPLPDGASYSREVLAKAVEAYLDGLHPPVHTGGFSMGGHTLLALAQSRPELFASLTLVGVSIRAHEGLDAWRARFHPDRIAREYPVWARHLSRAHSPLGGPDAWRDVCRRDAAGTRIDADLRALANLKCPVLLVRGDRDPAVDPGQYAELRAIWPQADELVVPAGGHEVHLTRHRLVSPALLDFLTRARAGRMPSSRMPSMRGPDACNNVTDRGDAT
jgi:pimeloyl-ACP methyl ester carboxylesterase